ncbi:MAG: hypothetical protein IJ315_00860 [Firmicutes bacterium]|nr:hypothetical protein [Bacillota bacterium]
MKKYVFTPGGWNQEDFMYVYSPKHKLFPEFTQEKNCIVNQQDPQMGEKFPYQYISMVTKERYGVGTKISTKCDFDHFGAPIIVLSDDIHEEEGHLFYNLHFEVVAYEKGCNVWHLVQDPARPERPLCPTKIACPEFVIEDGSMIEMSVEIKEKKLKIWVNDQCFEVEHPQLPKKCHIGITDCEGINHFYELTVEE